MSLSAKYPPKKRGARPPYGYVDDGSMYVPDLSILSILDEALDQLDRGVSLREACVWFNSHDLKPLTHMGLQKVWDRCRPDHPKKKGYGKLKDRLEKLTPEQRLEKKKRIKLATEKRIVIAAKKRIDNLAQEVSDIRQKKVVTEIPAGTTPYEEAVAEDEVPLFKPNPGPQWAFLASSEREVLYGGAAGGEVTSDFYRLLSQ